MAISAGAMVRTIGSWLTRVQTKDTVVDCKPVQDKGAGTSSIDWGTQDDGEIQWVRKGLDLMTIKSFNRGF